METKAYCSKCIYYKCDNNKITDKLDIKDTNLNTCCMAPQNIKDTNINKYSDMFISTPDIINKFNTCRWYQSIDETSPNTVFALTNLLYGKYKFQLLNNTNNEYTIDLLNYGDQIYQWQSTFKELLWKRDLYKTLDKKTKYSLTGNIKNSNLCDILIEINVELSTSYGITMDICKSIIYLTQGMNIDLSNIRFDNISKFYEMALRDNDSIKISFKIIPVFNQNDNCSGECNSFSSGEENSFSSGEMECNPNCSGEDDMYMWNIEFDKVFFIIE